MVDITGDSFIDMECIDDDDIDVLVVAFMAAQLIRSRVFKWNEKRLNWMEHRAKLLHKAKFHKQYRMTAAAFDALVDIVRPVVQVDVRMSMVSTPLSDSTIFPELVVAAGLRWVAGGSYHDISSYLGISDSSFYRCRDKFLDAVLQSDDPRLSIIWPNTHEECEKIAADFEKKSTHGVIKFCVGALDGLLIQIGRPTLKESDNPDSYFSGHYQMFGLNCQGVCDSHYRFTFFAVAAPGKTGDIRAMERTPLPALIADLPFLFYIVGDAAYVASDKLLTPFKGNQRNTPENSSFNFYLSQIRIRIEAAFGLLTTKFQILRGGLVGCSLPVASDTIMACVRLHNFVLNVDGIEREDNVRLEQVRNMAHDRAVVRNEDGHPIGFLLSGMDDLESHQQEGISRIRDGIVHIIRASDIQRPIENILRNQNR